VARAARNNGVDAAEGARVTLDAAAPADQMLRRCGAAALRSRFAVCGLRFANDREELHASTWGVLIVAMVAIGAFGLYALRQTQSTNAANFEVARELIDAVDSARAAEVSFKIQIQEFKDVLLRGHDPKDYDKYLTAFKDHNEVIDKQFDSVQATMTRLGAKLVSDAGQTMEEIVTSITRVSDLIAEIAAASQQQSAGIEQVNIAIAQMDQVVQQNASLVEEATAATESMKEQAGSLLDTVSRFKLGEGAAQSQPSALSASFRPAPAPIRIRNPALNLRLSPTASAARPGAGQWTEF
jgi:hypothetical protein